MAESDLNGNEDTRIPRVVWFLAGIAVTLAGVCLALQAVVLVG